MRCGQARRRDATERAIVQALRAVGAFVVRLSGDGAPDLLVLWRDRWTPLEVKSAAGKVRVNQGRYPIVRTVEEAFRAIESGAMTRAAMLEHAGGQSTKQIAK